MGDLRDALIDLEDVLSAVRGLAEKSVSVAHLSQKLDDLDQRVRLLEGVLRDHLAGEKAGGADG